MDNGHACDWTVWWIHFGPPRLGTCRVDMEIEAIAMVNSVERGKTIALHCQLNKGGIYLVTPSGGEVIK